MSAELSDSNDAEPKSAAHRYHRYHTRLNNILLIPLCGIAIVDMSSPGRVPFGPLYYSLCASFLIEWGTGLALAESRLAYLISPQKLLDLVTSIPVGLFAQSARALRVVRILRGVQIVLRARRLRRSLASASYIVVATLATGAFTISAVEPETFPTFADGLWWSIATLSTVGYGDLVPTSHVGRFVAGAIILTGIGVFAYLAGSMSALLGAREDDETQERLDKLEERIREVLELLRSDSKTGPS